MKFKLIEIGYWRSDGEPFYPDPQPGEWGESDKAAVLLFLNSGDVRRRYRGHSRCRVCDCSNGSVDRTDGVFVWPDGLSHYVEEHDIILPEVFVKYVTGDARGREAFDRLCSEMGAKFQWVPLSEDEKRKARKKAYEDRIAGVYREVSAEIGQIIDREILKDIREQVEEDERDP